MKPFYVTSLNFHSLNPILKIVTLPDKEDPARSEDCEESCEADWASQQAGLMRRKSEGMIFT